MLIWEEKSKKRLSPELNIPKYRNMKGIIFDIQQYAIYDGPGIRTLIFLKGCPLSCFWCQNPESQQLEPQMAYFQEKCVLCGKCVKICPENAITLSDDRIIREKKICKKCGKCVEICPENVVQIIGEEKSIKDIIEIVIRDKPFYDNSGGGITVSGGEPTMQTEFLINLLKNIKKKGIHTAIETCGCFNPEMVEKFVSVVDLFLFDIKHIDPELHEYYTGVSNENILYNFHQIYKLVGPERIICRIPLIPDVNTDQKTIQGIIDFLKGIGFTGLVHLMPYNRMAKTKYEKIGKADEYRDMGELREDEIETIVKLLKSQSFEVVVNE
ncbi:MAG: glycyl-radical enzyme activating protein [Candidatus Lokiarchaeota archaeon]|nr:glycyl-radical enzyme activating protein [Candidatus Lokiarchaeota archaeon]